MMQLSDINIGIIGGGQLGRMLILDAQRLTLSPTFIDSNEPFLPGMSGLREAVGSLIDSEFIYSYGKSKDVLTLELENVSVDGLERLEEKGVSVFPSASVIRIIQDKSLQKKFYQAHNIPTLPFAIHVGKSALKLAVEQGNLSFPFVWKASRGGYDGKGVRVIYNALDIDQLPDVLCVSEHFLSSKSEVAVIIARKKTGETAIYPPAAMEFDPNAHVLSLVSIPADLPQDIHRKLLDITFELAEKLKIVGTLAVEFFLDEKHNIYVNESAPRVHNSGHWTMNGAETSQFEQHWRAILGLPLGSTRITSPTVMYNLLGSPSASGGKPQYKGMLEILKLPGVYIHDYGKATVTPYRKMGHINVCREYTSTAYAVVKDVISAIEVTDKE